MLGQKNVFSRVTSFSCVLLLSMGTGCTSCDPGEEGVEGQLRFSGAELGDFIDSDPAPHLTAVGGIQTIRVWEDADGDGNYDPMSSFFAVEGPGDGAFEIASQGPPDVVITGLAAGDRKLDIHESEGGPRVDSYEISVASVDQACLIRPTLLDSFPVSDDQIGADPCYPVAFGLGVAPATNKLIIGLFSGAEMERVVDEAMEFTVLPAEFGLLDGEWDSLSFTDSALPPVGEYDIEFTYGLATVKVVDGVTDVSWIDTSLWGEDGNSDMQLNPVGEPTGPGNALALSASQVYCFRAEYNEYAVYGVEWTFDSNEMLAVVQTSSPNCVEITGMAGGTGTMTVTATIPGAGDNSMFYEIEVSG